MSGAVRLPTAAPFSLQATVRVLQRRPANPVDVWHEGRYLRAIPTQEGLALVAVENRGTIDEPDLRYAILSGALGAVPHRHIGPLLRRMLGLDVDPVPFAALAAAQPRLRAAAAALRGMRPPRFSALFESFANVVPFQQLSLDAGVAIVKRLVERFGEHIEYGGRRFYAFPDASAVAASPLEALRACGLSARKAQTLRDLARAIASGQLDERSIARMPTARALQKLLELPGIGPWSAGLILLRGLGRLDVFPPGDVGATRGLAELMHIESGAPLDGAIESFGQLRGFVYFHALGTRLVKEGLIHPAPRAPDRGRYPGKA